MIKAFKEFEEIDTKPIIGKRILAGLIDYSIIFTFTIIVSVYYGEPTGIEGETTINGFPALLPILFWFLMTVFAENYLGATIGNKIAGLKPISINNEDDKPSMGQSFKRHLLDPIDMSMFGLIAIITIKNTQYNQRLGDLWAKTIVVHNKNYNQVRF